MKDARDSSGLVSGKKLDADSSLSARAYPVINFMFLIFFATSLMLLAISEVTPSQRVRVPWSSAELPDLCLHKQANGEPCASCGITRSLISAMHGEWSRSWQFHRAGIPILFMLLAQCLMRLAFFHPRWRRPTLDVCVSVAMLFSFGWLLQGW